MLSVIIKDDGEPRVTAYTFEKLYTELKDIPGSELLIKPAWDVADVKNRFVCFVEADCLVSEGYFKKQLEAFKPLSPRVVTLSGATAVKHWHNLIYGYYFDTSRVIPNRHPKANRCYPVQVAYIPGALMRTSSLKRLLKSLGIKGLENDLVYYSSKLSLLGWQKGITDDDKHPGGQLGAQIYINPSVAYATTEDYVNDLGDFLEPLEDRLLTLFSRESI